MFSVNTLYACESKSGFHKAKQLTQIGKATLAYVYLLSYQSAIPTYFTANAVELENISLSNTLCSEQRILRCVNIIFDVLLQQEAPNEHSRLWQGKMTRY